MTIGGRTRLGAAALLVLAAAGAATLYAGAAPTCASDPATTHVTELLASQFGLKSLIYNDITTLSGGPFARSRGCAAQVAEIRDLVNASALRWHPVHYTTENAKPFGPATYTAQIGDAVPLAAPHPSLWERWVALF